MVDSFFILLCETKFLGYGNIKKHLTKAGETCYEWCNKTKDFGEKYYNKIKDYINKKS